MKNKIILLALATALSGIGDALAAEPPNFVTADKNKDGKLSPSEFADADKGRKVGPGDMNTKEMFAKFDTDSDGSISPNEFAPYRVRRGETTGKKKKKDK